MFVPPAFVYPISVGVFVFAIILQNLLWVLLTILNGLLLAALFTNAHYATRTAVAFIEIGGRLICITLATMFTEHLILQGGL